MQNLYLRSVRAGTAPSGPLGQPAAHRGLSALGGVGRAKPRPRWSIERVFRGRLCRWTQGRREARPRRVKCCHELQRSVQVARWARCRSVQNASKGVAFQGLCFGDFHLAQQMKVTRPPGRDPAGNAARAAAQKQDKLNARKAPDLQQSD